MKEKGEGQQHKESHSYFLFLVSQLTRGGGEGLFVLTVFFSNNILVQGHEVLGREVEGVNQEGQLLVLLEVRDTICVPLGQSFVTVDEDFTFLVSLSLHLQEVVDNSGFFFVLLFHSLYLIGEVENGEAVASDLLMSLLQFLLGVQKLLLVSVELFESGKHIEHLVFDCTLFFFFKWELQNNVFREEEKEKKKKEDQSITSSLASRVSFSFIFFF